MKRILRSFFLLLLVIVWSSNALAVTSPYSYTFGKAQNADFTSKNQTRKLGGIDWTLASDAQNIITTSNPSGQQIGSNKKPVKNATISTTAIPGTIKSITVTAKAASKDAKISLSALVNNVQYGNNFNLSNDKESVCEFKNINNLQSGKIEIKFINSASKGGFFIKNITVTFEEGTSETATTVIFPKESLNLIDGDEAAQGQNATVKAGEKTLTGATVTYSFESADGIFNETSDGIFSLNAGTYGTGKVTATFAGGEIDGVTYAKSSASYIVNYSAAKTPALTFSAAKVTVKQGEEASFVKPTITFTDKRGDDITAAADIIYVASPETVVKLDNEGNVTQWLAPGVATITATTEYGNNYYDASYTLTYEKVKLATTLTLDEGLKTTGKIGETLDCPAWTLKAGENVLSGKTVALTSDNDDVVKVDGNQLKLVAAGSANITLNFKGDDDYQKSETSYKLTVVDPNAAEATFDFSKPNDYGCEAPGVSKGTEIGEGKSIVSGKVSLTVTKESSNAKSRFWNSNGEITYRIYEGTINTVSVPQGYVITAISITDNNNGKSKLITIGENKDNSDWTGSAQSVIITGTGKAVLETMTVAYSKLPSIDLDESQDNAETISSNADKTVNVNLTRTLKADVWNTFCVPFNVTVAGSPLEGATIKQIASVAEKTDGAGAVINFEDAPATLEAGKAYLVRTATAIVNPTFNGVTVKNVTPANCSGNENYQLIGIYSPLNIDASLYGKVFGINNQDKLAKVKQDTSIKGMRAYFLLANSAAAAKLNFGGELTGIDAVDNGEAVMTGKVYNLNGQYVGNSLEGLKKGVYVVNGKKVLK